jgi:hypothetical protein
MSRKSRTVMFRSTDIPIVSNETKISIPVSLYLRYKYSRGLVSPLLEREIPALSGFAATVSEEVAEQRDGIFCEEPPVNNEGVVETGIGRGVMEGTGVAGFGVGGCEDQAR